jgi:stress response protein YsnF
MASYTTEKTVVGLFDEMRDAERAVSELEREGIPRSDISVLAGNESGRYGQYLEPADKTGKKVATGAGAGAAIGGGLGLVAGLTALAIPGFGPIIAAGPIAAALTGAGIGAATGGLIGGLTSSGVSREDAEYYAEGVRRGGVLVTVKTDEGLADRAADILDGAGARDVDERASEWRKSGWSGPTALTDDALRQDRTTERDATMSRTGEHRHGETRKEERRVPVVEENINIGHRERIRGGVRVYSRMHERPVEESIDLREERVNVERRPVNRPANIGDFEAFKEGTLELRETVEEPVVEKTARVKEEVVVGKDVHHRTEKVRDTVRSTDVNVERLGQEEGYASDYDRDFRSDYESRYAGRGHSYDRYRPAYEFGSQYASDNRYRGRDWSHVEGDLRGDWETRGHGRWEDFKDSIRYGWDRVRGRR